MGDPSLPRGLASGSFWRHLDDSLHHPETLRYAQGDIRESLNKSPSPHRLPRPDKSGLAMTEGACPSPQILRPDESGLQNDVGGKDSE
jgi:hypothetical protein